MIVGRDDVVGNRAGIKRFVSDIKFEMKICHPSGDNEEAMRHKSLEFRGDIWTGGINVGVIRVYIFNLMGLVVFTLAVDVDEEGQRS